MPSRLGVFSASRVRVEDGLQGVQRAGADIAVDDADRGQRQRRQAAFLVLLAQDVHHLLFWCGAQ
jgi:hypothetical protein